MAGKVLIGGTEYTISGGKALIGGTSYSIGGGITLIDGTAKAISFGGLPSQFQECEWIGCGAEQYIDTTVIPTSNMVSTIVVARNTRCSTCFYGVESDWSSAMYDLWVWESNKNHFTYYRGSATDRYLANCFPYNSATFHTIEYGKNGCTIDSSTVSTYASGTLPSYPIWIGSGNRSGAVHDGGDGIMYFKSVVITDDGVVFNGVPCYCTTTVTGYKGSTAVSCASGTIGLFDLVNSRFYVNSGSGTFTKGGDV